MPKKEVLNLKKDLKLEYTWLEHQMAICKKGTQLRPTVNVSWAAYHASREEDPPTAQTNASLLPFFLEKSTSVSVISHVMNNNAAATQFLNPGQTHVLTMDQLYLL